MFPERPFERGDVPASADGVRVAARLDRMRRAVAALSRRAAVTAFRAETG